MTIIFHKHCRRHRNQYQTPNSMKQHISSLLFHKNIVPHIRNEDQWICIGQFSKIFIYHQFLLQNICFCVLDFIFVIKFWSSKLTNVKKIMHSNFSIVNYFFIDFELVIRNQISIENAQINSHPVQFHHKQVRSSFEMNPKPLLF